MAIPEDINEREYYKFDSNNFVKRSAYFKSSDITTQVPRIVERLNL